MVKHWCWSVTFKRVISPSYSLDSLETLNCICKFVPVAEKNRSVLLVFLVSIGLSLEKLWGIRVSQLSCAKFHSNQTVSRQTLSPSSIQMLFPSFRLPNAWPYTNVHVSLWVCCEMHNGIFKKPTIRLNCTTGKNSHIWVINTIIFCIPILNAIKSKNRFVHKWIFINEKFPRFSLTYVRVCSCLVFLPFFSFALCRFTTHGKETS